MDNIIPQFYKRYGMHINHSRAFPLAIDGLKPVERRVLLSAYDIARDKFIKCAKVDGHCIGNYHPHGSVYGTIVQMVHQGFLDGQGNFGTNIGVDPCPEAAMRYTEVRLTKETNDLAFRLIKYVPWKDGEIVSDKEPVFLPVKVPMCLLGNEYSQGIGMGFRTFIPCYRKEDLFNRLLFLIGKRKTKPTIKPITDCDIISTDAELEQILTTGKGTLRVKGKFTLEPHHSRVILHSWPVGKSFEALIGNKKISNYFDSSDIAFDDLSSGTTTKIAFEVIKQRSRDVIYKSFAKDLESVLIGSVPFDTIVVVENNGIPAVKQMSIDQMLLDTYKMYTEMNKKMLEEEKQNRLNSIEEYKLLLKVRPHLANEIKNKITNIDETINKISLASSVTIESIKRLFSKNTINKLLTLEVDESSLMSEVNYYQNKLDNLEAYVVEQYQR